MAIDNVDSKQKESSPAEAAAKGILNGRKEGGDITDENFINNPDHPVKAKQREDAEKPHTFSKDDTDKK